MIRQLIALFKKDIKLIFQHKLFWVMLGSILVYSLYINFVYVKLDVGEYPIYLCDESNYYREHSLLGKDFVHVLADKEELYESLKNDKDGIGIIVINENGQLKYKEIIYDSSSEKINKSKELYAGYLLSNEVDEIDIEHIGSEDYEMKKRLEMTSVVIFFEITTISFLGIAALFFKEKEMGVLKIYGTLPASSPLFIVSKIILFFIMEVIFATLMSIVNIGIEYSLGVALDILIQISILSPIMVLSGFFFSLAYKNFKQFVYAYTVIITIATSPVFLFVTSSLEWIGIKFFPTYYLFSALYDVFFKQWNHNVFYYCICYFTIIFLTFIDLKYMKREIRRGWSNA